ncbi:MAG TPA: inner membrane-spanning protein YciB [Candidatus Binatia bacterium]|nr:inner membrane-spanning protein YciB [Candidatus Binatia bacterium]
MNDEVPLAPAQPKKPGANQLLIDLGPIAVFVVAFNVLQRFEATKENAVYIATAIFIASTLAAIGYCKLKQGRIPPVLIVTGVLVTCFGGLTLLLHDENYIKIKPTFVYFFYAAAITVSVMIRQNVWKLLFRHVFNLPDRIWNVLALRWAGLFVFLALLNEYVRLTQTTEFWVNSRLFIFTPFVIGFALLNTPLVLKHNRDDEAAPQQAAPSA